MHDLRMQILLSQTDRKKQSKSSTTYVSISWNKSQLLYASVGSLTVAIFFFQTKEEELEKSIVSYLNC